MTLWLKRIGLGLLALIVLLLVVGGAYAYTQASAYDASVEKVYDIPLPNLVHSTDPAVIARGQHLALSIAACALSGCHTADLGGGHVTDGGPIGRNRSPNITMVLPAYSDGELARLIRYGVKKDGRTVRFMPVPDFTWLPDSDVVALMSFVRSKPLVNRPSGNPEIKLLGKIMDRKGFIPIDVARRIDHAKAGKGPAPSPTLEYGRFIGGGCSGCHGEHMSGGKIPGTPPDFPIPLNITPHETGLKGWTVEDLKKLAATGTRKDGRKLASFMPVEAINNMDDVEITALWKYLSSLPPRPFGER